MDRTTHGAERERLGQAGLSEAQADRKADLLERCRQQLAGFGVDSRARKTTWFVPGRIEVLGKHTDYAAGRSLLVAVEQGFCIMATERADPVVRMADATTGDAVQFDLAPDLAPISGHWSNYPMTVARRVARNFPGPLRGADIAFASDLPPAAGLSSSSALVVATFLVLSDLNALHERPEYRANIASNEALAGYLGTVENGQTFGTLGGDKGVGTFGGSQDHTAILCCQAGQVSQYSFCPVRLERMIQMPPDYVFVIGVSGMVAEKTGEAMAKYNRVSRRVSAIVELWRQMTGRDDRYLADAFRSSPDAPQRLRSIIQQSTEASTFGVQSLLDRLEQFAHESEQIIPAAGDALAAGKLGRWGELVDQSQTLAERYLENQVPQTIFLARSARELGSVAASAFGAGFGGSVWAMVRRAEAEAFTRQWQEHYRQEHPRQAARSTFVTTLAGPGAMRISDAG